MAINDPRIDAYIENSAEFARPILTHIRHLVHTAVPGITETIKWSAPFFDYKGPVCNMAAFKEHAAFGFWKSRLLPDPHGILKENNDNAAGQLGRITAVNNLPPDEVLIDYIRNAVVLNETGEKLPKKSVPLATVEVPDFFVNELAKFPAAERNFEGFSNSGKKEYVQWVTEAKTDATKLKRLATAMEWITDGKARHWKYER